MAGSSLPTVTADTLRIPDSTCLVSLDLLEIGKTESLVMYHQIQIV